MHSPISKTALTSLLMALVKMSAVASVCNHKILLLEAVLSESDENLAHLLETQIGRQALHATFKEPENTLLHQAAANGRATVLATLIKYGATVNSPNHLSETPLHCAAALGCAATVRILLGHNANPNARDSLGNTPLHRSAKCMQNRIIPLLINAGAHVDIKNCYKQTPLQLAIKSGAPATVKLLLMLGADSNARSDDDESMLFVAIMTLITKQQSHLTSNPTHLAPFMRTIYTLVKRGAKLNHESARLLQKLGRPTLFGQLVKIRREYRCAISIFRDQLRDQHNLPMDLVNIIVNSPDGNNNHKTSYLIA